MGLFSGVDITVANSQTDVFLNESGGDLTLNFSVLNRTGGTVHINMWAVKSGGSASNANKIEQLRGIKANGVYERWAITLGNGDKIVMSSDKASVNVVAWGA